jgi:predicted HicB family RNase H-like nuclease
VTDSTLRIHAVRVPDDVWKAAAAKAAANDETMSQVIRRALREYAARR